MALLEVPAARANEENRNFVVELVLFPSGWVVVRDGAPDGITQVDLAFKQVAPNGRAGVLEVGHEYLGARVKSVDDHFAIDGSGDLHAAVQDVSGQRRYR